MRPEAVKEQVGSRKRLIAIGVGLACSILLLLAVQSLAPSSLSVIGPEQASAAEYKPNDTYHTHYTTRGDIPTRYGFEGPRPGNFGYKHMLNEGHGWHPGSITRTISEGRRAPQYEKFLTSRTYVKWFGPKGKRTRFRVTFDIRQNPDGDIRGVINAFVDKRDIDRRFNPC